MGRAKTQMGLSLQMEEGYEAQISKSICILIDDWEGRVLNQRFTTGKGGSRINHYWLVKKMLWNLIDDMLRNCSEVHDMVLAVKAKMVEMDVQLIHLENTFS